MGVGVGGSGREERLEGGKGREGGGAGWGTLSLELLAMAKSFNPPAIAQQTPVHVSGHNKDGEAQSDRGARGQVVLAERTVVVSSSISYLSRSMLAQSSAQLAISTGTASRTAAIASTLGTTVCMPMPS